MFFDLAIDLDTLMIRPDRKLNNIASPSSLPFVPLCNSNQTTTYFGHLRASKKQSGIDSSQRDMAERSKELLRLEHKGTPLSSLETALLVCDNKRESNAKTNRLPPDGTSLTAPLPPSQLLGKVKDFLGVMSEANKRLELDAKDGPEKYDIEELTGNESEVIEMDLMLGVTDLHTPEAVAAAESAISSCQPVISLAADGSETDSEESSTDDDDGDDDEIDSNVDECDDGNNGEKPLPVVQKSISGKDNIHEEQKVNCRSKKRPRIVELS